MSLPLARCVIFRHRDRHFITGTFPIRRRRITTDGLRSARPGA
jgi:hypothetical protein